VELLGDGDEVAQQPRVEVDGHVRKLTAEVSESHPNRCWTWTV
jgi:hypothetical protein